MSLQHQTAADHATDMPHRDDHCLLLLVTHGHCTVNLDFNHFPLAAPTLLLVLPGQVHQLLTINQPQGWAIRFDPLLIDDALKLTLERGLTGPMPIHAQSAFYNQIIPLMALIESVELGPVRTHTSRTLSALLTALLSLVASEITHPTSDLKTKESRAVLIEQAFIRLLNQHFKAQKQPAWYAAELAISVAHLNDTLKKQTGQPVSDHIQQRAILEAKRLLFFTDLSVREVGYETGYDEPVYFGKLFRKRVGSTPLHFRQQFRD